MTRPKQVRSLQELADLAGVSLATASRALSDHPDANEKTKQRVRSLAKKYNYRVNERARDLRLKQSRCVSVVLTLDIRAEQRVFDPFFLEMLSAIAGSLAKHDYDLLLSHAPLQTIDELNESRVLRRSDGIIFVGQRKQHELLNHLADTGFPVVAWGSSLPDKTYCLVGSDDEQGGYLATRHLLGLGRRRIAFFGDPKFPEVAKRLVGYQRALVEYDLALEPGLSLPVPFELRDAEQTIRGSLEDLPRFDAAICCSDVMAMGAMAALGKAGLRVPEDIAIVGYDDIAPAEFSNPPLTTIRQDIQMAGQVLVDSVLNLINGVPVSDAILENELIVRQSCGA